MHKVEGEKSLSVKGGCLEDLENLEWGDAVHIWCKEAVGGGISIPPGARRYEEEPPEENGAEGEDEEDMKV